MRSTTVQRMALKRLAAPTPMIDVDTQCVVDTGMPKADAAKITSAPLVSATKPLMGCSLTILWPSVLMMRQPPPAVPAAITSAHRITTQVGMAKPPLADSGMRRNSSHCGKSFNVPAAVAPANARATIPMVFCASFMPCDRPMAAADSNCDLPKTALTKGVRPRRLANPLRREHHNRNAYSAHINSKAITKPSNGEITIGIITLGTTPLACHQCSPAETHQITESKLLALAANAAPTRPPTSAWLELDGKPCHQVIRFQMQAPSKALIRKYAPSWTTSALTRPSAIVLATAVPSNAPIMLVTAAKNTAWPGVRTLVATTVAMEFAVSWKPLM